MTLYYKYLRSKSYALCVAILVLTLFNVSLTTSVQAQTKLTGRIFEYKTHIALSGIKIEDLKTHVIAIADTGGRFSIKAAVGDKIVCAAMSYKPDTIYLADLKYKEIFLEPREDMMLKEVKIVNQEFNLGAVAAAPTGPLGSKTVKYQTDANGNARGGIAIALPGSNTEEKKRREDTQLAADEKTQAEIDNVFTAQNLVKYVPLKGQEMTNFTILYRPTLKIYRDKFNLPIYVDDCYKEFLKIPLEKRQSKELLDINK